MPRKPLPAGLRRLHKKPVALSIRQPWAHRILFQGKDIENRGRRTNYRGWVLIHAGLNLDEREAEHASINMPRGGIVGAARIVDCVDASDSDWFFGPFGYVLEEPTPIAFIPCRGMLGFFTPELNGASFRSPGAVRGDVKKRTVHIFQEAAANGDWALKVEGSGRYRMRGRSFDDCLTAARNIARRSGSQIVVHHLFGTVGFTHETLGMSPATSAPDAGFRPVPRRRDTSLERDPSTGVEVKTYSNDRGPSGLRRHTILRDVSTSEGGQTRLARKTEDTLFRMYRLGDIGPGEHNAGRKFQRLFQRAAVNPTARSSMELVDGGGQGDMADGAVGAREELYQILDDVGGAGGPTGRVLWHCLGNGLSFNQFAQIDVAGQARINRHEAKGMLRTALAQLARRWRKTDDLKVVEG